MITFKTIKIEKPPNRKNCEKYDAALKMVITFNRLTDFLPGFSYLYSYKHIYVLKTQHFFKYTYINNTLLLIRKNEAFV